MAFYQLVRTQKISATPREVWDFISSPSNLQEITPRNMGFLITSKNGNEKMYPGMIITYKVKPLFGLKVNWVTEITHIREFEFFVDEQRSGPYSMWHHEHKIEQVEGGILMTDTVTYKPPFGFIGSVVNSLFIKKRLKQIFDYRSVVLEKKFPGPNINRGTILNE
ncbi:MAG TPA: SRPBCC family protein [Bacteroidales bacterium]|nr:SRPBCC family protein [Bacteroidales bacterium]